MSVPMIDPTLTTNLNANFMNNAISTLQGLNTARKQFLQNQALQATVQYAGPQAAANLNQTQLGNQKTTLQMPYVAPQAKANVENTQAQTGLYGAEAQLSGAKANYMPYTTANAFLGSYSKIRQAQAAADRVKLAYYNSTEGQNLLANNKTAQQDYAATVQRMQADGASGIMGNFPSTMGGMPNVSTNAATQLGGQSTSPLPMNANPAANLNAGGITPGQPLNGNQVNRLASIMLSGKGATGVVPQNNMASSNMPAQNLPAAVPQASVQAPMAQAAPTQMSGVQAQSSDPASLIQQAAQNQYTKAQFNSDQINQIKRANSTDAILKQVAPLMPDVIKFAGLAGRTNQSIGDVKQSLNIPDNDPSYKNFVIATQQKLPLAANEIIRALGIHATDNQKEDAKMLANPDLWNKSPELALNLFNSLSDSLNAVESQIAKNPTESIQQLQQNVQNPILAGNTGDKFNASDYFQSMQKNPGQAKAMYQSLPIAQRQLLKSYNELRKQK